MKFMYWVSDEGSDPPPEVRKPWYRWETWNAVLDAGVDVPAELAERRGLRGVQQLQHDELLMREFCAGQPLQNAVNLLTNIQPIVQFSDKFRTLGD